MPYKKKTTDQTHQLTFASGNYQEPGDQVTK